MKRFLLFLVLSLMLSPQAFAARGVDYNGAGNAVTLNSDASGLTLASGQSLNAGFVVSAGGLSAGNGLLVSSGSTTITAGNLRLTNGNVQVVGTSKGVAITSGSLTIGTGSVQVETGGVVVTTGNIEIMSGDFIADDGKITVRGPVKQWSNGAVYVDSLAGTATAREGVRLLKSGAGDTAAIGSTYRSSTTGKLYIKVANSHVDADWKLVTSTDAD
jgi:hypothetical protein